MALSSDAFNEAGACSLALDETLVSSPLTKTYMRAYRSSVSSRGIQMNEWPLLGDRVGRPNGRLGVHSR
jgi:hypothetical protein